MKRFCVAVAMVWLVLISQSQANSFTSPLETDLYQVFNHFFYAANDGSALTSDADLLASSFFLPNDQDEVWGQPGERLRVDVTFSNAIFGQELGYLYNGEYTSLIGVDQLADNGYTQQNHVLQMPGSVVLADTIYALGDPIQRWYSQQALNPLGAKDHLLAFSITDNALLAVFNALYGTAYDAAVDQVWMIAFEDLNLGNADYTDLVAVMAKPAAINATPVPASVLLLGSGFAGLAAWRRRRNSHSS